MLRQPHGPAHDNPLRPTDAESELVNLCHVETCRLTHVVPGELSQMCRELPESVGVLSNELMVEYRPRCGVLGFEQLPIESLEQRQIAIYADLQELVA